MLLMYAVSSPKTDFIDKAIWPGSVLVTHSVHTSNFPSLKILFKTLSLRAGACAPRDLQRADIAFTLVSLAERHAKDTHSESALQHQ